MFTWAIIIILAVWLIVKYTNKASTQPKNGEPITTTDEVISEETVFNAQNSFEKKFEETYLPDSLSGKDIYIYRNLMHKWFFELSGKHRYNDDMIKKLRRDFLDYMWSKDQFRTSHYLSLELDDKDSQKEYEEESRTLAKKIYTIENAFAAAIGSEAIKDLERVRELDCSTINKEGSLAPEGYKFDFTGELKPLRKDQSSTRL